MYMAMGARALESSVLYVYVYVYICMHICMYMSERAALRMLMTKLHAVTKGKRQVTECKTDSRVDSVHGSLQACTQKKTAAGYM